MDTIRPTYSGGRATEGQRIITRSGTSFAQDATIDAFLNDSDRRALYERWKTAWGEPLDCGAGETAITCEMVLSVSISDLVAAYGRTRAKRLQDAAKRNTTF